METKKFLFVSADAALITDLAWQIHTEGHDVKYYIEAESDQEIGNGFVPKSDDWRAEVDWADVIIFDDIWVGSDIGTGGLAQELREQGKAVVGGTPNTDRLEEDRGYAMEVLEEHGVNTIEHQVFHDFDAGIQHVQENPAPYVIKPLGEVQNVKRLLYVGSEDDGSDVVDVLSAYKKAWGHRMKGFQLQRKVEGVEVAVCGFFDGDQFVDRVNFNFEHKKLFPGNIGPSTGEMGTAMFWAGQNKLYAKTLGRLESWLASHTATTQTSTCTTGIRSLSAWFSHRSPSTTNKPTTRTRGMLLWCSRQKAGKGSTLRTRRRWMGSGVWLATTGCPSS
jgi:phosphoribosylamine--glycine ligase